MQYLEIELLLDNIVCFLKRAIFDPHREEIHIIGQKTMGTLYCCFIKGKMIEPKSKD